MLLKSFFNLLVNIFAPWEANFVSAATFLMVGKRENIVTKHNVPEAVFAILPKAEIWNETKLNG